MKRLSPRQLSIARLVAQGLEDKEIADRFGISVRAVQQHVLRARRKVNAPNRVVLGVLYDRKFRNGTDPSA